jgi:predicted nucleic-acid-binding protein
MAIADANIILRYVLDDHPELSRQATEIIENNFVTLPIEVACEVVFVLQKVYEIEREIIQEILGDLIQNNLIFLEQRELLLKALDCYSKTRFDFVDCLLWAYQEVEGESIFTFDRKLEKYLQRGVQ